MKLHKLIFLLSLFYFACNSKDEMEPLRPEVKLSTYIDHRDNNEYQCIQIGNQLWMAENLRYRIAAGPKDGCFTWNEKLPRWNDIVYDEEAFKKAVYDAIEIGTIKDPEDVDPKKGPIAFIKGNMEMMIRFQGVPFFMDHCMKNFPEIYSELETIDEIVFNQSMLTTIQLNYSKYQETNGQDIKNYGLLYTYSAARNAIPEGWRLPSDEDWKILEQSLGMKLKEVEQINKWRGNREGACLKEGEEGIMFNARLTGECASGYFSETSFINRGVNSYFWSSTESTSTDTVTFVITRGIHLYYNSIWRGTSPINAALSVRCIKQ